MKDLNYIAHIMKKFLLLLLIASFNLFGQETKTEQKPQPIVSDNPAEVCGFFDEIKDIFVKKAGETDTQHIARIKTSLTAKQFKNKKLSEIVLVIQEGFRYESQPESFTVDFYNRKIIGSDMILGVETLPYGFIVNGLEKPEMHANLYEIPELKKDLRLAVYGFPIGCDTKYKVVKIMPLRYVFFDAVTNEVHHDDLAQNQFADYYFNDKLPPEAVLATREDFDTNFGGPGSISVGSGYKPVRVRSYYRRDGTFVRSYTRSLPKRRP